MSLVFLDRDGVINRFPGKGLYVTRVDDFHFLPGALEAIQRLTKAGAEIHVVSNQGCVSRGLISGSELDRMTDEMLAQIQSYGGRIQQVHYCRHQTSDACECKKPKIKLFQNAIGDRAIDLNTVCFVGDSLEDIQAGKNLGCKALLVLSGRTVREDLTQWPVQPDTIQNNLMDAVTWILQKK